MQGLGRQMLAAATAMAIALAAGTAAANVKAGVDAWMTGNYEAAVKAWRPLADKGDADAQFNLGQAYKLGRGVQGDLRVAQTWFEKAAKQGHGQAQANLGLILFQNGDRAAALPWIRKAADAGDPRAQYILGTALFNGDLVGKDWPRAYALMMRAAEHGLPQATKNLEEMNRFIPLEQRREGIAIADELKKSAAAQAAKASAPRPAPKPAKPAFASAAPGKAATGGNALPSRAIAAPSPARPATPAQPAASGGGWRVQLGAFSTAGNAQRAWSGIKGKVSALAGLQPRLVPAGAMTRLQAGTLPDRASADKVCAAAKAAGSACFPVAP